MGETFRGERPSTDAERREFDEAELALAFDAIIAGQQSASALSAPAPGVPASGTVFVGPSVWDAGAPGVALPQRIELPPVVTIVQTGPAAVTVAPTAAPTAAQQRRVAPHPVDPPSVILADRDPLGVLGTALVMVAALGLAVEQLLLGRAVGALPVVVIGVLGAMAATLGIRVITVRDRRSVLGLLSGGGGIAVAALSIVLSLALAISHPAAGFSVAEAAPVASSTSTTHLWTGFGQAATIGKLTVQVGAPQSFTRTPATGSSAARSPIAAANDPSYVEPAVSVVVTIMNSGSTSIRMPVTVSASAADGPSIPVVDRTLGIGSGGYRVLAAGDTVSYRLGFGVSDASTMKVMVRDSAGDTVTFGQR